MQNLEKYNKPLMELTEIKGYNDLEGLAMGLKYHEANHTKVASYSSRKIAKLAFDIQETSRDVLWLSTKA